MMQDQGRLRTEIAHIVVADRVGSSQLTIEAKALLNAELLQAVQGFDAIRHVAGGDSIMLDSGDGLVLVMFGDPALAAECAEYLHETVALKSQTPLRIGIHSGPVIRRIDVAGRPNAAGPGIDKAERVMSCADGTSIFVSDFFAENLRAFGSWRDRLAEVGERTVKHDEVVRLFRIKPREAAAPLVVKPKLAILYKRNAEADEGLVKTLEAKMRAEGFDVFIDRHLSVGVAWAQEIERQIRASEAVVVLLSAQSIASEMLVYEVQTAANEHDLSQRPRILPVRVQFTAPLFGELAALLNPFQHTFWNGPQDDDRIGREIAAAANASTDSAPRPPVAALEPAGGAVPLDSKFYIVRETDHEFQSALLNRESLVLVKGPRQIGKTSLLGRALEKAAEAGSHIVLTDFQAFSSVDIQSDVRLYHSLADQMSVQLGLDVDVSQAWNAWLGANSNLEKFMQNQVLGTVEGHLIWGLDEVDRLFTQPFASDFFGMLRSWHNRRALRGDGPWRRLTIAIAYATEAHLFITDLNQSPFNVGTRLLLSDFSVDQVRELNGRYGSPMREPSETERLWQLTGGHPYLVRRALDELVKRKMTFDDLAAIAAEEEGPFGDQLRRMLMGVSKDPELLAEVRSVLAGTGSPSVEGFYRLRSAGVLKGDKPETARMRCELYRTYLERHHV